MGCIRLHYPQTGILCRRCHKSDILSISCCKACHFFLLVVSGCMKHWFKGKEGHPKCIRISICNRMLGIYGINVIQVSMKP